MQATVAIKKDDLAKNLAFKGILEERTKLMKNDRNETQLLFQDAILSADRLLEHLQTTEKTSMISFIYNERASLMRAQALLIEIGEHILEFCDYVN